MDIESDYVDGSGPIFSMYLEMAIEEDKKMAENWKADAEGILIFVRLSSDLVSHRLNGHRPVYSPLLLQLWSQFPFRISKRIHRTPPISTSLTSTRLLLTRMDPTFRVPSLLPHPPSLHQTMQCG